MFKALSLTVCPSYFSDIVSKANKPANFTLSVMHFAFFEEQLMK